MSEEGKLQKFLRAYFSEPKIKEDYAQKIIKQAKQFENQKRHKDFLKLFFQNLKKSYDPKNPKNFVKACKRFLFIINQLLGKQIKKEKQGKYNELISQQIVQYYLFFFEIIFKNSLHELIVELKMYRMKWAKLITNSAFIHLRQTFDIQTGNKFKIFRQQIMKKHNKFNLDRGFSEENIKKIQKIHFQRGLTQKQSSFYLTLAVKDEKHDQKQQSSSNQSSESSSEQSDEQNQKGFKRIFKNQVSSYSNNFYPEPQSYGYNSVSNVSNLTYGRQMYENYSIDPRSNRKPLNEKLYQTGMYRSNGSEISLDKISNPQFNTDSSLQSSHIHPLLYSYQPQSQQQVVLNHDLNEPNDFQKTEFNDSILVKIQKIRRQLQKGLLKCRQCGQSFQTNQNYEKHRNEHFFNALEKVQSSETTALMKKQSKKILLDLKSWQSVSQSGQKQEYQFEVLLSDVNELKTPRFKCYFCNEELKISFSVKYESWVFIEAIKIHYQEKIKIVHFECYQSFKLDQNSSNST